jgi:glycosyltransferase involved in cell wall biosynthesis
LDMPVHGAVVGMTGTKTPSVSVIVLSYNHELYVYDAVESVLRSSVEDIEVIVIDDGSSDRSVSIIEGIKDLRLKLGSQEIQGAHHTMNRGLSVATGA